MKKFWRLLGALLLFLGATACVATPHSQPLAPQTVAGATAVAGVLDLRQWDFEQNSVVNLNGEWEFYWAQLLTPADFAVTSATTKTGLIIVPGAWRGYPVAGQAFSGDGYATYRLLVLLPPAAHAEKFLALKMPVAINTAHRLYIDGQWVGAAGQVGATAEQMTPQHRPYIAVFAPTRARVEILLQISSFYQYDGGVAQPLVLGTPAQIQQLNEQQWGRDFFLLGSIFIMGLYHLVLFALRRRDKAPLYFGLFCLLVVGGFLLLTQPQIFAATFSPTWEAYVRTLLLLGSVVIFTQALFFHTLFPQAAWPPVLKGLLGGMVLFAGLALWLPLRATPQLVLPLTLYLLLVHLYMLALLLRAVVQRQAGARIALLGCGPLLVTAINDALVFSQHSQAEPLVVVGVFGFILAQSYLLSARFSQAFRQTERLAADLRRSEAKYRTLFEDAKDLVFITALDGRVEAVNPACFAVLGYTQAEALGLNAADFYADPAERLRFQTAMARAGAVTDFPVLLRHKAGHELDCQLTATARHDKTGQLIGYQGIIHDVTAYKQVEAARQRVLALQDLTESLEQRVEARTLALTEASAALQAEIEQRQSHQQEKERLLVLAQQQSEHLRTMSHWLIELQKGPSFSQAVILDEDLRQKIADIRQNLSALQGLAGFEQNLSLVTYVFDTLRLLTEVEVYVEQVTTTLDEPNPSADPLAGSPLLQLSSRERQVLKLMAEGKSNPEIATRLTVQLNTVHTYLKRIRSKLGIQDTLGLINFARDHGLLR